MNKLYHIAVHETGHAIAGFELNVFDSICMDKYTPHCKMVYCSNGVDIYKESVILSAGIIASIKSGWITKNEVGKINTTSDGMTLEYYIQELRKKTRLSRDQLYTDITTHANEIVERNWELIKNIAIILAYRYVTTGKKYLQKIDFKKLVKTVKQWSSDTKKVD